MRSVKHVAYMGEKRYGYKILVQILKGRSNLEYLGINGRIILEWMFR
jgi:hypothetical protein